MPHALEGRAEAESGHRVAGGQGGRGEAVVLSCGDSDAALRALLASYPAARDIEVRGAGLEARVEAVAPNLEDVFVAATRSDDRPREAAA